MPATSTVAAMQSGTLAAVLGGISMLKDALASQTPDVSLQTFVTGGDGALLAPQLPAPVEAWPEMTLEGLRLAMAHWEGA
jgi:pantothenate kinase type III